MPIESQNEQLLCIVGKEDARHIPVCRDGKLHLANDTTLDVEAMNADNTILRSGYGILVIVRSRVLRVIILFGTQTLVPRKTEHRHFRLVVTNPGDHCIVCVEIESACKRELLFVHPIRLAIDNLVELAVLRDLTLAIVEEKFDEEEVSISNKCHHRAVPAPKGLFLRPAFAEMSEGAVLHIIYIIFSRFAMTVDALRLCLDEDVLLVRTHLIAVDSVNLDAVLDVVHVEEHTGLLSRSETVSDNLLAVP